MNVHCISDIEDVELIEVTGRYIDGVCLQTTTEINCMCENKVVKEIFTSVKPIFTPLLLSYCYLNAIFTKFILC